VRHGGAQEVAGRALAFVGVHLHEAGSGVVIDGHVGKLPACSFDRVAPVAGGAVASAHDAPELLGVHVQQLARLDVLVAHHHCWRLERPQAGQP
jgi:hypothetical protein